MNDSFAKSVRKDFALLINNPDIAYLDSAATTHRPDCVLKAIENFYKESNANPLRGLYELSVKATDCYEQARDKVRAFINADSCEEIVFTGNTTGSMNLLGYSLGEYLLNEGDEVLITIMEHHSNILPWQHAVRRKNAVLKYIECDSEGKLDIDAFKAMLSDKTKIVSVCGISNVLGCLNDIKTLAKAAHEKGAVFVCDGAQMVPHMPVDVKDLDVDFLAFSGHKMCAPMGIGVLYGKAELLDKMPPFMTGGEMIEYVTRFDATYAELPHKFEAGTVNASGAVGLRAAIEYYEEVGFDNIVEQEAVLGRYAFEQLKDIPHLNLLGAHDADSHHGIFTFTIDDVHPHDIAAIMDSDKVCVRAGHHCAQPLMQFMNTQSTARVSLAFYNTFEEIDRMAESIKNIRPRMGFR
ncbi:MAG: SufS family cysteine desulfurase [Lachnospiraceae bacterium]|nr:SufS family cysteine desulfurase [Lachnospiraceae bacterium]